MREVEYNGATCFQPTIGGQWLLFTSYGKLTGPLDNLLDMVDKMDAINREKDPSVDFDWVCLTCKELQADLDLHLSEEGLPAHTAGSAER